jgi:hypothetical protein
MIAADQKNENPAGWNSDSGGMEGDIAEVGISRQQAKCALVNYLAVR